MARNKVNFKLKKAKILTPRLTLYLIFGLFYPNGKNYDNHRQTEQNSFPLFSFSLPFSIFLR